MKQSELLHQARHLARVLAMNYTNLNTPENSVLTHQISTLYGQSLVAQHLNYFDLVFSAWPYCRSAFHLRRLFKNQKAFPFDWWLTPATSLYKMLEPEYNYYLKSEHIHLTQSGQIVLNDHDQVLHLHDFKRLSSGGVCLENLKNQLDEINSKYSFLFKRLHDHLHAANNCVLIFKGLIPANELERYRVNSSCKELIYSNLNINFASELVNMLNINYNITATLVSFEIGAPAIEQRNKLLSISAPALASVFNNDAEPYQRPWTTYELLFALLCVALSGTQVDL